MPTDNTSIDTPATPQANKIATEDVGGNVSMPRGKIVRGAHGVDGGDVTMTNPLEVVLSDGANAVGTTGNPLKVAGTVTTTPSGTQTVAGSVSVSNLPDTQTVAGEVETSTPDVMATGTLAGVSQTVELDVGDGQATWYFELTAVGVGTSIVWEKSVDGTTWSGLNAWTSTGGGTLVTSLAGSGVAFRGRTNCSAFAKVRVRCSLWNGTDSITVTMRAGTGDSGTYLVAPLPAGSAVIGGVTAAQADASKLNTTATQGTPAALGNAWPVIPTDGTNTMPTGDVPGRSLQVEQTDGTNVIGTPSHPTRVAVQDTNGHSQPTGDAAARAIVVALSDAIATILGTSTNPLRVDPTGSTPQPVTVAALPLPAGAATDANIANRLGLLGQHAAGGSTSVVLASDQAAIAVLPQDGSGNVQGTSAHPTRTDPTGTTTQPISGSVGQGTAAALAGAWPVEVTDGTHTMPAGDAPARAVNTVVTDGTNVLGTAAHPQRTDPTGTTPQPVTLAAVPLPAGAATSALQTSGGQKTQVVDALGNVQPAGDTRAHAQQVTPGDATNAQTFKAASTAAAATDIPAVVALHPSSPLPAGSALIGGVTVQDGAGHTQPAGDAIARSVAVQVNDGTNVLGTLAHPVQSAITDGTHALPTADAPARKLFGAVTDGTNTAAVKAASTAPAATDPALVVALSPNGPATVVGSGASGSAVSGNPVLAAGSDGANAHTLLTDTSGRLENVGAAAAGAAAAGNPVQVGGIDPAGKVQALSQNSDKSLAVCLTNDAQALLSAASVAASGSAIFVGLGHKEVNVVVNVRTVPTGTLPTLTFAIQELDPIDQATAVGASVTGAALNAVGTQQLQLPNTTTGCVKVTWTIGGTATPTFPSVDALLSVKPTVVVTEQFAPVAEDNTNGVFAVVLKPVAVATYAWTTAFTTALATNLIAKAAAGVLRKLFVRVDSTATTGTYYVQLFNSATLPADTTGTGSMLVAPKRVALTSGTEQYLELDYTDAGIAFTAGLVVVLSTTEFTKTIVTSSWLSCTAMLK